ncbi:MAG: sigma-54-dependent Fis family transcriptional regulator [Candidatus Schekmanbacteria bacterium]|nr:sigma-54-dependent Fis family transcriptional regulator [Candidatus Schekmanbacteria bacterium]
MNRRLLIVDDEENLRFSLTKGLEKNGYEVAGVSRGFEAFQIMEKQDFDLVLLDICLPDMNGLEILDKIKAAQPQLPIIMMTAFGEVGIAVRAMKLGAYDYIGKPFLLDEMRLVIQKALETVSLKDEVAYLRRQKELSPAPMFIGQNPQIRKIRQLIEMVSKTPRTSVLLQAESGCGKEVIANLIHCRSQRADKPLIKIDCSTIPETLLDTELFGHKKGSFTDAKEDRKGLFELADGGTAFLDEIGEMKLMLQPKFLQVLETQTIRRVGESKDIKIDTRIIAATNRNLQQMVKEKTFRQDLYYRLKVMVIEIPPLRERKEDILPLAQYFLDQYNREFKKAVKEITPQAQEFLQDHAWPGNVRELKNAMERATLLADAVITPAHLPLDMNDGTALADIDSLSNLSLDEMEKQHIRRVLKHVGGNKSQAAESLKISRSTLWQKLRKYGLDGE